MRTHGQALRDRACAPGVALKPAGTSTLYRSPQGLTMVIETSLKDLLRRGRRNRR